MITTVVNASWPRSGRCPIAFVGEAPSDEELIAGRPFVGPAGRTFTAMMRTAGLDRNEALVTNVFNVKLPNNELASWLMSYDEARAVEGGTSLPPINHGFLKMEHRHHLDRLKEELCTCKPNVIVPLGATALWALSGLEGISAVRGTVLAAKKLVPGMKLLPTMHPQAVNYSWKFFPVVVGDFVRASAESRFASIILPHRELFIEPTIEDLHAYTDRLRASSLLSVDIETSWGQLTSIGFAPDAEHAIVVPFFDKRQPDRSYWRTVSDEVAAWRWVQAALASDVPKLGQNYGGYDFFWLLVKYRLATRNAREDTRLLSHALFPELPKDLEFMGASYATQGAWKYWGRGEKKDD